jgi:hypothetical protein
MDSFQIFGEIFQVCLIRHCRYWTRNLCEVKDFDRVVEITERQVFGKGFSKSTLESCDEKLTVENVKFDNIEQEETAQTVKKFNLSIYLGKYS